MGTLLDKIKKTSDYLFSRIMSEKIDTDKDGYLTYEELKKWVEHVSHRYLPYMYM